jgi:hypothetical protein
MAALGFHAREGRRRCRGSFIGERSAPLRLASFMFRSMEWGVADILVGYAGPGAGRAIGRRHPSPSICLPRSL